MRCRAQGPVNQGALELMAKFPMVTVEKFQGPCGNSKAAAPACDQESQIIAVLKGVKAINPNASCIFYYNSVLDFQQYRLHAMMEADPSLMLHDQNGNVVKMGGGGKNSDVFDFSNAKARELFIQECINATKSGYVDGCFADRAVDGTPTDSGDDRVPCTGQNCRYKLNLTAAKAKAYAAGHVQVLTDLQTALVRGRFQCCRGPFWLRFTYVTVLVERSRVETPGAGGGADDRQPRLRPAPRQHEAGLGVLLVSRPFSSWNRSILTEVYLCHAYSCQEILRAKTAGQDDRGLRPQQRLDRAAAAQRRQRPRSAGARQAIRSLRRGVPDRRRLPRILRDRCGVRGVLLGGRFD
jgi:hypothetical protein